MNGNPDSASSPQPFASNSETVEWCLGLPLVGRRPLTAEESSNLARQSGTMRVKGCLLGCFSPLIFLLGIALLACLPDGEEIVLPLAFLALFVPLAALILVSGDAWKRGKGAGGDVSARYVKCFRGPLRTFEGPIPGEYQEQLLNLGYSSAAATREIEIEVLPVSQRLWKVDGVDVAGWVFARSSTVARLPNSAGVVTAWAEPMPVPKDQKPGESPIPSHHEGRRDLSPAEIKELKIRIRRLWLPQFWPTLFISAWACIPLYGCFSSGLPIYKEPSACFLIAIALVRDWLLFDILREVKLLRRDVKNGQLNVLASPAGERGEEMVQEVLSISGWAWTVGGVPALWRRQPL